MGKSQDIINMSHALQTGMFWVGHGVLTQKTEKHSCRASGLGEAYLDSFAARLVYCLVGNYFQRDIDRPGPLAYILPKHALLGGLIGQSLHEICRQDPLG